MQILDAYAKALGVSTMTELVNEHYDRKRRGRFVPTVPVNQSAAIERNRLKWEKKAQKAKKLMNKE